MLNRKQYWWTLFIGAIVFLILFAAAYGYAAWQAKRIGTARETQREQTAIAAPWKTEHEICIQPSTRITFYVQNMAREKIAQSTIEADSLLGLTKEQLAKRFKEYSIETFNEKQVTLVRTERLMNSPGLEAPAYRVTLEGESIYIESLRKKEKPICLNASAKDLSSYAYELILKGEVKLTNKEKERLIDGEYTLEQILQNYDEK